MLARNFSGYTLALTLPGIINFIIHTDSVGHYAVFEYLAVKCIEQRAKEATERAQKTEATTIGKEMISNNNRHSLCFNFVL